VEDNDIVVRETDRPIGLAVPLGDRSLVVNWLIIKVCRLLAPIVRSPSADLARNQSLYHLTGTARANKL
jgi:hypothetical protein